MPADHHAARRAVALLAAVVLAVVAALTLTAGPAVADTGTLARTGVAAFDLAEPNGVGPTADITAGQGRETSVDSYDLASGSRVATRASGGGVGDDLARAGAGGGDDMTRVGRWMSPEEHTAMVDSGHVQVGSGGTTSVASPANPESYMPQARPGSHYVEFDVPSNSVFPGGRSDWAQIPGPDHVVARLAAKRGNPVPSPVPACNIVHVLTKPLRGSGC
jgi:hypothetical protein